jgi:hypothetical protein
LLDSLELLERDLSAVRDARSKARTGGDVPGRDLGRGP